MSNSYVDLSCDSNQLWSQEGPQIFTKFFPSLTIFTKKVEATLIMGQMEYWFSKYKDGFYKFMEPCAHAHYRDGDSWTEELTLSRKVFNKAFECIGVRYKSKSEFDKAEDKFQGKLYASYYDRKENKTYYVRNHFLVQDLFSKFFGSHKKKSPPKPKIETDSSASYVRGPVYNGPKGRSRIYKDTTKIINTSIPPKSPKIEKLKGRGGEDNRIKEYEETPPSETLTAEDWTTLKKMREVWLDVTHNTIRTPEIRGEKVALKTLSILKNSFNDSLERWRNYCKRIASSCFLMGKNASGFKAWFVWCLNPSTIERIQNGEFGVDTTIPLVPSSEIDRCEKLEKQEVLEEIAQSDESEGAKALRSYFITAKGVACYKSWLAKAKISIGEGRLTIFVPSEFQKTYVETHFRKAFDWYVDASETLSEIQVEVNR